MQRAASSAGTSYMIGVQLVAKIEPSLKHGFIPSGWWSFLYIWNVFQASQANMLAFRSRH